jgi:hypothetical protein
VAFCTQLPRVCFRLKVCVGASDKLQRDARVSMGKMRGHLAQLSSSVYILPRICLGLDVQAVLPRSVSPSISPTSYVPSVEMCAAKRLCSIVAIFFVTNVSVWL